MLHIDFEIFDNLDDFLKGTEKWTFCNFNDSDVGYPRDCGKNGFIPNKWFSLPGGKHNIAGGVGASFHIYSAVDCVVGLT